MNTLEKPTVPTPSTLAEITPELNQGDFVEVEPTEPEQLRPVLGGVATREEYRQNQISEDNSNIEDVTDNELDGFTVIDATQNFGEIPHDTDELPDELKDELGEPDNDEVDAA